MADQSHRPLAERMRPKSPDGLVGQEHFWGPQSRLRRLAEQGAFGSLIFWGPPGSGKTSLARLLGQIAGFPWRSLSAVSAGTKDLRAVIEDSQAELRLAKRPLLLFLDEIHRLNKAQQDVLLPAIEAGELKMIGATTENPSFQVNAAILSRSLAFRFLPLAEEAVKQVLRQASEQRFWQAPVETVADEVLESVADASGGDLRSALNIFEALMLGLPMIEQASIAGIWMRWA